MIAQLYTRSGMLKELRTTPALRYSWCLARIRAWSLLGKWTEGAVWSGTMVWWEGGCTEWVQELEADVTHPLQLPQAAAG